MKNKWLIIGSDKRLEAVSALLLEKGQCCEYTASDGFDEAIAEQLKRFKPDILVTPVLAMQPPIPAELLPQDTAVFSGQTAAQWKEALEQRGIVHKSYLSDEYFVWENAGLTAEAFVQLFYEQTKRTIAGKHFYVTGFGRVAKAAALKLASLGGDVTIAARSEAQLAEAAHSGYKTVQLDARYCFERDYVVNTIPAAWLDAEQISGAHVFDLSSAPGCLKIPHSSEYYTIHLKLPGKYFPQDAAIALCNSLLRMNEERGIACSKENESD